MTEPPRRLSRLGAKSGLLKTTPNVEVVRKKGSSAGKVDLLPAVPTSLKKRKLPDNQGKLKKVQKARVTFVPPPEFLHNKSKAASVAVMPVFRQTPAQLQLTDQLTAAVEEVPEVKRESDASNPPVQLPFKPMTSGRSPLLSALSPRPLPLPPPPTIANNSNFFEFALDGPSRAHSLPLSNHNLMPLPNITRQHTAPAPAARNGYIKQENGLARLLFRSDSLDSEPHSSPLLFVQLPTSLPIQTPPAITPKPISDKQILAHKIKELEQANPKEGTSLQQIPPGFLGNITLFKSGRMVLQLGEVSLNVSTGVRKACSEEVVAMFPESRECCSLGPISNRLVCSLDETT